VSRALFDRGGFGVYSSRVFDSQFRDIFGVRPRTVGEAAAADSDDTPGADLPAIPVSQRDEE